MKQTANLLIASPALALALALAAAILLSGCGDSGPAPSGSGDAATAPAAEAGKAPEAKPEAKSAGGQSVLTTEIPPQRIEGTPMPIQVPNLEPEPQAAAQLAVPEGTVLLSKGKPVTGSDDFPIVGELELITDGEKDAGEGYFVELMDGLQWVQIDLEEPTEIQGIWVWHFHSQKRAYHDVIVQVSDDPEFATGVTTLFNNDYDESGKIGKGNDKPYVETRFGKLIDAKGTKGRYVRLYSGGNTSNSANHYIEVEVYGKPAA